MSLSGLYSPECVENVFCELRLVAEHGEERPLRDFLLEDLYSFVGEGWEQEDDITLLTLERSPIRS